MIKINLALRKKAAAVESGKAKEGSTVQLKLDPDLVKELLKDTQFRKLILVIVIAVMANYWLSGYQTDQLDKMDASIAAVKAEGDKISKDLAKTKGYDEIKKQIDTDEELIKTKLATIQKLSSDREVPPKLMLSLSTGIPKDVWLSGLEYGSKGIHFRGAALGFDQITDFMKNLGDNAFLTDLKLLSSQKTTEEGTEVTSFELEAKRKPQ